MNPGLRSRAVIIAAVFACAFVVVIGRLAFLQVVRADELRRAAERQYSTTVTIRPKRGVILDRHGNTLAASSAAESLFARPRRITDVAGLARRIAPILGEAPADVARRLASDRPFVWLRRRLPPPAAETLRGLNGPGLGLEPETMRLYPNRELAAHVLGFEGVDGVGLEGIERVWNSHLAGTPGRALVERDARREVMAAPLVLTTPTPGGGVSLTLDTTIQYVVERELDLAYRRTQAKGAVAVVLDPRTGEILACAVRPAFNPNSFAMATANEWRNRAITDAFEPGSTFKVIVAAAALEEGVVKPTDRIYAGNGLITVANTRIHDWKKYGWLSFSEVLQHSSNVGSIKVGLALGRDRYHRYIIGFGFGAPTGVGLPGESRGLVRDPRQWSGLSLATLSIGQEVSVTALQLVAAVGAVANGGRLMQPRIVRALLDAEGRETRVFEPEVIRQVISPETARTLTRLLVRVVDQGTGHAAAIPGYEVGGKTGTAQKLDPRTRRYSHAPGVLSFVGVAPADDPRFVMLVLLDEPENERWGSEAAAPIFSAVGAELLRHLGVPPRDALPVQLVTGSPRRLPRDPSSWTRDAPRRAEEVMSGAPRIQLTGGLPAPETGAVMPSLAGRTLRHALAILAGPGIGVEIRGRGIVVGQTPPPGTPLASGMTARLELAPRLPSEATAAHTEPPSERR
jgi:cell division protein FtsI (penicillin-binding protein 3)